MKEILLHILLLSCFLGLAQEEKGKLLLFRIDILRDLKIEKKQFAYSVLELNDDASLKNTESSKRVFFDGFTDANIFSCIQKDSIQLTSLYQGDTFNHESQFQHNYNEVLKNVIKKMNPLIDISIRSKLIYNEKIKISYMLINAHYCKGKLAKRDSEIMNITDNVILILDELTFDSEYQIPKENSFDIIKAINYNSFIY